MLSGRRVRIGGRKARPERNGRCGVAGRFDTAKARYVVALEGSWRTERVTFHFGVPLQPCCVVLYLPLWQTLFELLPGSEFPFVCVSTTRRRVLFCVLPPTSSCRRTFS